MSEPTEDGPAGGQQATDDVAAQGGSAMMPDSYWSDIVADNTGQDDDTDSSFGDSGSSTASLSSSILRYRTINGRTYHSERGSAEYWVANDRPANEALDIIHHVLTLSLNNRLHLAPLEKNIEKVLDIGTGTGIWAIDFADEYPETQVIGTDISPIQPSWVPPNVEFQIDDCTQEWTFAENLFDYVHIRWLFGSIVDWEALFREAYKTTKPGGYLESHEPSICFESDDSTVHEGTAMSQFGSFFIEGSKKIGRSMTVVEDGVQRKAMEAAGFTDIKEYNFKTPIGSWPLNPKLKEIGRFQQAAVERDTEGTMLYMAQLVGWTPEDVRTYIARLWREFRSREIHGYYRQKIVWGRKPVSA